jgi:hypothetical protein
MRYTSIFSEAWRNFATGTSRAVVLTGLLVILASAPAITDVLATRQILNDASSFRSHSASIYVLTDKGRVIGSSCDALMRVEGIRAAGATRNAGSLTPVGAPDTPIPVKEVTPGFTRLFDAGTPTNGIAVSRQAAELLGLSTTRPLNTVTGTYAVASIFAYPEDGRATDLAFSALSVVTPQQRFDQCWFDIWPYSDQTVALSRVTAAGIPDAGSVDVAQLNASLGTQFPGEARFQHRPTLYAPIVALALGVLLGIFSVLPRRLEVAAALHLGVKRSSALGQLLIETATWVLAAGSIAETVTFFICRTGVTHGTAELFTLGTRSIISACIGCLLGAVTAFAPIREAQFFRYFKDR